MFDKAGVPLLSNAGGTRHSPSHVAGMGSARPGVRGVDLGWRLELGDGIPKTSPNGIPATTDTQCATKMASLYATGGKGGSALQEEARQSDSILQRICYGTVYGNWWLS